MKGGSGNFIGSGRVDEMTLYNFSTTKWSPRFTLTFKWMMYVIRPAWCARTSRRSYFSKTSFMLQFILTNAQNWIKIYLLIIYPCNISYFPFVFKEKLTSTTCPTTTYNTPPPQKKWRKLPSYHPSMLTRTSTAFFPCQQNIKETECLLFLEGVDLVSSGFAQPALGFFMCLSSNSPPLLAPFCRQ